jgi:hypothetical protein
MKSSIFVVILILGLSGCSTIGYTFGKPAVDACPTLPTIDPDQSFKDYTLEIVSIYNTCRDSKHGQ